MSTSSLARRAAPLLLSTGLAIMLTGAAVADSLTLNRTPVSNAVALLSQRYGIQIVLKGNIHTARRVSLSIDNMSAPGARLQVVNALANAVGAAYRKIFVVSKGTGDAPPPPVPIDTNADVVFQNTRVPTADAIRAVAGTDDAIVQIAGDIDGAVTLSDTTLPASQAADEIARQSHTHWKAFYLVATPGSDPRLRGTVVGYTSNGQPIIQSPLRTYTRPAPPVIAAAPPNPPAGGANGQNAAEANGNTETADNGAANPNNPNAGSGNPANSAYGYPGYDYASGPYGMYAPYGYGYGPYAPGPPAYQAGNVLNVNPYYGAASPYGYGNPYGYGGAPYSYGGVTILPEFPYSGDYGYGGAPVIIGGY